MRLGPKRPPIAAGLREDGSGVVRVARTPGSPDLSGWAEAVRSVLSSVEVEELDVCGPPVSADLRGAGWAEATVLAVALDALRRGRLGTGHPVTVVSPAKARAVTCIDAAGCVRVRLSAGDPLDEVVLRSYAVGAVHQALGWVRSEGVAVSDAGEVLDLTVRSFGIITAQAMPPVEVEIEGSEGPEQGAPRRCAEVTQYLPLWPRLPGSPGDCSRSGLSSEDVADRGREMEHERSDRALFTDGARGRPVCVLGAARSEKRS